MYGCHTRRRYAKPMSDTKLPSKKAKAAEKSKGTWPTASTRIPPDESRLVDAAAYKLELKRADIVYAGTIRYVREILGQSAAA